MYSNISTSSRFKRLTPPPQPILPHPQLKIAPLLRLPQRLHPRRLLKEPHIPTLLRTLHTTIKRLLHRHLLRIRTQLQTTTLHHRILPPQIFPELSTSPKHQLLLIPFIILVFFQLLFVRYVEAFEEAFV